MDTDDTNAFQLICESVLYTVLLYDVLHYLLQDLNSRYQALLQMYGEKEEEVSELRMDLVDVKQMYKQQVLFSLCIFDGGLFVYTRNRNNKLIQSFSFAVK